MKSAAFLFTLFLLPLQLVLGQTLRLNAIILGHDTREGLPYVSIGIKNTATGTTSDASGQFTLQANSRDTLVFSSVGYKTAVLLASEIASAVYLQEDVKALHEVVVKSGRLKTTRVGNLKSKTYVSLGGANQYAMLLQPDSGRGMLLEEVHFELQPDTRENNRWRTAIKVRVYANELGKPGRDLIPINLVVSADKKDRRIVVDVSQYAITVPREGVFIGIDFIGFFDNKGDFVPYSPNNRPLNLRIPFSITQASHRTFSRFFGTDWQLVRHRSSNSSLVNISAKFGARLSF